MSAFRDRCAMTTYNGAPLSLKNTRGSLRTRQCFLSHLSPFLLCHLELLELGRRGRVEDSRGFSCWEGSQLRFLLLLLLLLCVSLLIVVSPSFSARKTLRSLRNILLLILFHLVVCHRGLRVKQLHRTSW